MTLDSTDIAFEIGSGMMLKNGDATLVEKITAIVQAVRIESVTAIGDLWYDTEYGFGLQDFIHRDIDDMLRLEIYQRIKSKLIRYEDISPESITIQVENKNDSIRIHLKFSVSGQDIELILDLDRVKVEVNITDG